MYVCACMRGGTGVGHCVSAHKLCEHVAVYSASASAWQHTDTCCRLHGSSYQHGWSRWNRPSQTSRLQSCTRLSTLQLQPETLVPSCRRRKLSKKQRRTLVSLRLLCVRELLDTADCSLSGSCPPLVVTGATGSTVVLLAHPDFKEDDQAEQMLLPCFAIGFDAPRQCSRVVAADPIELKETRRQVLLGLIFKVLTQVLDFNFTIRIQSTMWGLHPFDSELDEGFDVPLVEVAIDDCNFDIENGWSIGNLKVLCSLCCHPTRPCVPFHMSILLIDVCRSLQRALLTMI